MGMKAVNRATLGLNMIVGGGESSILDRCLTSINATSTFDEIVIVNTSDDDAINEVADACGAKLIHKKWADDSYPYGDFAGARNVALDKSMTDYIMWLDADDVIAEEYRDKLGNMKAFVTDPANSLIDVFNIPYIIPIDGSDNTEYALLRDRIFRRCPTIRWANPVHESLSTQWESLKQHNYEDIQVLHAPAKTTQSSAKRNIRILHHELEHKNLRTFHNRYFLARDLLCDGQRNEASKIMESLISESGHDVQALYTLCMEAAFGYAYGGRKSHPELQDLDITQTAALERWLKQALGYTQSLAEPFFLLGELYTRTGELQQAEKMYSQALNKPLRKHSLQLTAYYRELPAHRLAGILLEQGNLEKALWANRIALQQTRESKTLREQRKTIITALLEEEF